MELNAFWRDLLPGSPTHLRWPWLALLLGALLLGLVVWWLRRHPSADRALAVSGTERLTRLPRFRRLVRRRRTWLALRGLSVALTALGCLLLVARPAAVTEYVDRPSRDLVVCLDASGSMRPIDARVVAAVQDVVEALPGDRVGLTLFDGQPVVKFPLTDDRGFVKRALEEAESAFRTGQESYYSATDAWYRSSQLADGLHSCVHGFDRLEERRGRVVLVVSDNLPFGPPVHDLDEVTRQARDRDVVVHALGPPWLARRPGAQAELRRAVAATGGSLAMLDDRTAVGRVVDHIDRIEQRRLATPPRRVAEDRPQSGVLAAATGVGLLALLSYRRRP